MRISVIIPTYNNSRELQSCLAGLNASSYPASEIIVVDDASPNETPTVPFGVRVLRLSRNVGPAGARNFGARHATGEIVMFVDADVVVHSDAIRRVLQAFTEQPSLDAVFGSYDAHPPAVGTVSQYRNLLHHFVHQNGNSDASTFWAGCGGIRRSVFQRLGGFDQRRFPKASIEDIELGYRLRTAGHQILLDKALQGTHLKRWTLCSMIWTDLTRRAVPWSRLILERHDAPRDLNLKSGQRISVALVGLAVLCLPMSAFWYELSVASAVALLAVIVANRRLYSFFGRRHGLRFAAACVPLHLLYFLCAGIGYLCSRLTVQSQRKGLTARPCELR